MDVFGNWGIAENKIGTRVMSLFFGQISSEESLQTADCGDVAELAAYRDSDQTSSRNLALHDQATIHRFPCVDDIVERLTTNTETEDRRLHAR